MKNLSMIDGAIRKGYLINCTIEIHAGIPKLALSKKIAKDKCPTCGGPITDIESDVYVCKYCGSKIKSIKISKVNSRGKIL